MCLLVCWTHACEHARTLEREERASTKITQCGAYNFLASFEFSVDGCCCCVKCFINMLPVWLGLCIWDNSALCFCSVFSKTILQFNLYSAPFSFTLSCNSCWTNACPHTPYYDHITNVAINLFQHKNHHSFPSFFPSYPCRLKDIQSTIRMWRSSIKHYQFAFVLLFLTFLFVFLLLLGWSRCEFRYQTHIKWFICAVYW